MIAWKFSKRVEVQKWGAQQRKFDLSQDHLH
jgi:hypothetical protein